MHLNQGPVTEHLRDLVSRQVADHGLVIWFDPERHYEEMAASLVLPDADILRYDGSFFALRKRADAHMEMGRPRLVVYVPLAEEDTGDALAEMTAPGVVMKPGHASRPRNTRLAVVARTALSSYYPESDLGNIVRQVEEGKLRFADVDGTPGGGPMILSLVFEADDPQEITLRFLAGDQYDASLTDRDAVGDLALFLANTYGLPAARDASLSAVRARLAIHLLATEFLATLKGDLPAQLAAVGSQTEVARQAGAALVRAWRSDRARRESYAVWAGQAQTDLGIATLTLSAEQVGEVETFLHVEGVLQDEIERWLTDAVTFRSRAAEGYRCLIASRLGDFWSVWPERFDAVRPRWIALRTLLDLLAMAETIEMELKTVPANPAELLRGYTRDQHPWCLLDLYFRQLEQHVHTFDLVHQFPMLAQAVVQARRRYMAVGGDLAERFTRAFADAKFQIPDALRQTQVYDRRVKPHIEEGKVGYVLVDALRFEMAREQSERLAREYDVTLEVAVATAPTVTPVGMASLLPGAEQGVRVAPVGPGSIALEVGGKTLATRKDRIDHFCRVHPGAVVATLEEALTHHSKPLDAKLQAAPIILVTSQEIDALAEGDNIHQAWLVMEFVLAQLGRLVNRLRDYGCQTIVVAADHGYLFGEELDVDMKIDPPGGQTVDLHRRAWIGKGGAADPAYLRTPLSALGVGGDLDLAVPWGFGVFKAPGGARAYFHGGLSPQELAIPVMTLRPHGGAARSAASDITWEVAVGSGRISTRFCAVTLGGQAVGLMIGEAPAVRLEVRSAGQVISAPVSAGYGLDDATGDVHLRVRADDPRSLDPDTVTLMITPVSNERSATIHLIDAVTGRELTDALTVSLSIQEY